jgi:AAA family ATP:ADP antiporter
MNVFLLLVCYSVLKTVREPLILLGGGAEVRSYAAAGQAALLIGFVPLYSWFAGRVNRARLLVGMGLFFIAGLEIFAAGVAAHVPYVGVAFFIWVGIFNISLVAQFWSFANDIYNKEAGDRLFPIIMMGMTAGAPMGSFIAARLFRSGIQPAMILHVAAVLLATTVAIYLRINRRDEQRATQPAERLSDSGGFSLVLASPYLRLIAGVIILLNVVNTTGEYLVARLLTAHVSELAQASASFDKQAYIGAFSGDYQFSVNIVALLLQAFVASRLVKYRGLAGVLLALPMIALGGYAVIAAGVGFSVVRWIKTAENATDYSIMNTARQLLWLPTSREEKYKAKQAIDTFGVRIGDLLSAGVVYVGAHMLHLSVSQFAVVNLAFAAVWLLTALRIVGISRALPRVEFRTLAGAAAAALFLALATPAHAQGSRDEQITSLQAEKATQLHDYVPDTLEERLDRIDRMLNSKPLFYPFIGGVLDGGGLAVGPGFRKHFGDSGSIDAHGAWSIRNYKGVDATATLPSFADGRVQVGIRGQFIDAPEIGFYGIGNESPDTRMDYAYRTGTIGGTAQLHAVGQFTVGAGLDAMTFETTLGATGLALNPDYARTRLFAEVDTRSSPGYSRSAGLYRVDWAGYHQTNAGTQSFNRIDAEVRQFVPLMHENWVLAFRGLVSTTNTSIGEEVPYFLLPDLGGSHNLRGYSNWRFRDRNRLLLSGEYRWTAGPFVDMALFLDAGKVTSKVSDLDLGGLTKTYGIGLSLHSFTRTAARVELAHTPDGMSLGISFSPSW